MLKKMILAGAMLAATAAPAAAQTSTRVDPAFMAQLKAALDQEPGIVLAALQKNQAQERQAAQAKQAEAAAKFMPLFQARTPVGPVIGDPAAKITVAELLDYACPFCKQAHDTVNQIVAERKDVRFIIVMRAVLGPDSEKLARFALASDLQGKFVATHNALYEKFGDDHQTKATDEALKAIAAKVGLDYDKAVADMNGTKVNQTFAKHTQIANDMGVSGTPFFLTEKTAFPGAVPKNILEQSLTK